MRTKEEIATELLIDKYLSAPWKLYGVNVNNTESQVKDVFEAEGPEFNSPYKQILVVCQRGKHGIDYIRQQVIKILSWGTPTTYFLTKESFEDFLRYYCVSKKEMVITKFKKENIETDDFNRVCNYLEQLKSLPLKIITKLGRYDVLPQSRLTVIDNMEPFLDEHSPEDKITQKLTLLQAFKIAAGKSQSTQLILWETEGKNIEKEIRPEVLTVPDLTLFLQETEKKQVYKLTGYHDVRKRTIEMTLAYDSQYGLFMEF